MSEKGEGISCDAASCMVGIAIGVTLGLVGCALAYLSIRRRSTSLPMRLMGGEWYEKGNG